MKNPEDIIKELENEDLYNAYTEIKELNKTGILPEGITKRLYNEITSGINQVIGVTFITNMIIAEIADRWYDEGL